MRPFDIVWPKPVLVGRSPVCVFGAYCVQCVIRAATVCVLGVSDGVQCAVRDGTYDAADVPDVRIEGLDGYNMDGV